MPVFLMKQISVILVLILSLSSNAQPKNREIDSLENLLPGLIGTNRYYTEKSLIILKYYSLGFQDKAKQILVKALDETNREQSKFGFGTLYNTKSNIFYYESKFDSSLFYLEKALAIRQDIKDTIGTLKILSNLGGNH